MDKKTQVGIAVILFIFLLISLWPYYRTYTRKKEASNYTVALTPEQQERLIIEGSDVTHVTRSKDEVKVKTYPKVRKMSVTVSTGGNVTVYTRRWGLIFEPGISVAMRDQAFIGLDVQWFYMNRSGFTAGVGVESRLKKYNFYGAYSYNLPFKVFDNTSIFIGLNQDLRATAGIRLGF